MRVALLCCGLGNVLRGHETFATQLFEMLRSRCDYTLFKGAGPAGPGEVTVENLPRNSPLLGHVHPKANPRWAEAVREQERHRIEAETFAYAALKPLMEGGYDVVHCLEREVCAVLHRERHLFERPPRLLFSNGGAIPARDLPPCDAVQEHTEYNRRYSAQSKAFMIPHGVDLQRFRPGVEARSREELGVAPGCRKVAISVGTICHHHKRMDHLIEEFERLPDWHLLIVGQESAESDAIRALGRNRLGERVSFHRSAHADLPSYYAAADAFVLGSLFETFGIVYIEAMAMGLPVFCTQHPNQRLIVQEGEFVDMARRGDLAQALARHTPESLRELGQRGRKVAEREFDLAGLPDRYLAQYQRLADLPPPLPQWTAADQWRARATNLGHRLVDLVRGRAN